jgi:hypothetical protein
MSDALRRAPWLVLPCAACLAFAAAPPGDRDRLTVGRQPDGRFLVPTNQILEPTGRQVTFFGRPVDLALADGGKTVVVKNMKSLLGV